MRCVDNYRSIEGVLNLILLMIEVSYFVIVTLMQHGITPGRVYLNLPKKALYKNHVYAILQGPFVCYLQVQCANTTKAYTSYLKL